MLIEGDAEMVGPEPTDLHASAALASSSLDCQAPECSSLWFSEGGSEPPTLENLVLRTHGSTNLLHEQDLISSIDEVRIQLVHPVEGTSELGIPAFTLATGTVPFIVSGAASDIRTGVVAWNATPLTVNDAGPLTISAFTLEFIDGSEDTWTLDVGSTAWE